jgi:AcrR family transcriptional regulator
MSPRKYELGRRAESIEETRRRIVDATFELHGEKGVVATSMQEIAERADVALRTVYNHYPTIDDLVAGCGERVMSVLAPPTREIFNGAESFEARMRRLVEELFAMYARGPEMIEVATCEQREVAKLGEFVARIATIHEGLVSEALQPFRPRRRTIDEVAALTDFYVWKAFNQRGISTRQAADVIHRGLAALADPDTLGKDGRKR